MALLQDFDLLEVDHGAVVDRNACIFCHVGIFRDRAFVIEQVPLQAPTDISSLPCLREACLQHPKAGHP